MAIATGAGTWVDAVSRRRELSGAIGQQLRRSSARPGCGGVTCRLARPAIRRSATERADSSVRDEAPTPVRSMSSAPVGSGPFRWPSSGSIGAVGTVHRRDGIGFPRSDGTFPSAGALRARRGRPSAPGFRSPPPQDQEGAVADHGHDAGRARRAGGVLGLRPGSRWAWGGCSHTAMQKPLGARSCRKGAPVRCAVRSRRRGSASRWRAPAGFGPAWSRPTVEVDLAGQPVRASPVAARCTGFAPLAISSVPSPAHRLAASSRHSARRPRCGPQPRAAPWVIRTGCRLVKAFFPGPAGGYRGPGCECGRSGRFSSAADDAGKAAPTPCPSRARPERRCSVPSGCGRTQSEISGAVASREASVACSCAPHLGPPPGRLRAGCADATQRHRLAIQRRGRCLARSVAPPASRWALARSDARQQCALPAWCVCEAVTTRVRIGTGQVFGTVSIRVPAACGQRARVQTAAPGRRDQCCRRRSLRRRRRSGSPQGQAFVQDGEQRGAGAASTVTLPVHREVPSSVPFASIQFRKRGSLRCRAGSDVPSGKETISASAHIQPVAMIMISEAPSVATKNSMSHDQHAPRAGPATVPLPPRIAYQHHVLQDQDHQKMLPI